MYYPRELIDEIRLQNDIVDVIGALEGGCLPVNADSSGIYGMLNGEKGIEQIVRLEVLHIENLLTKSKLGLSCTRILTKAGQLTVDIHLIPRDLRQNEGRAYQFQVIGVAKALAHSCLLFGADQVHVLLG